MFSFVHVDYYHSKSQYFRLIKTQHYRKNHSTLTETLVRRYISSIKTKNEAETLVPNSLYI